MDVSVVVFMACFFSTIFGIFYIIISARNKERMMLIEKGADASIFYSSKKKNNNVLLVLTLNLALLLFSIGIAIFLGAILVQNLNVQPGVAYPGTIFTISGLGLYVGYQMTLKMNQKSEN